MHPEIYISDDVRQMALLHQSIFDQTFFRLTVRDQLEKLADNLLAAHANGRPAAAIEVKNYLPGHIGAWVETILASKFTLPCLKQQWTRWFWATANNCASCSNKMKG